jgi:hypothetical protein
MKSITIHRRLLPALILVLVLLSVLWYGSAHAQTGGIYDLSWNTFDGGGTTTAAGGIYSLNATVGQPEAGKQSGGIYTLFGGFWMEIIYKVFLPLIFK